MSNLTIGTILEFISNFLKIDNTQNLNTNDSSVAYGGGMAGNKFNPINFFKKPQVIFRILSIVRIRRFYNLCFIYLTFNVLRYFQLSFLAAYLQIASIKQKELVL
jgi:hypothetical protein